MTTGTTTAPPTSLRETILDAYDPEHARTMRVLRSHSNEKAEVRPHLQAQTAREPAWMFVIEQGAMPTALTTGFDFSKRLQFPQPPESFNAVLQAVEDGHQHTAGLIRGLRDEELHKPTQFMLGPGKVGDMPLRDLLWMMIHDQIHHRGQFSVYLRMADAKVPAIYGPSLDEPWM